MGISRRGPFYSFRPPGRALTVGMLCASDAEAIERAAAWCRRNCAGGSRHLRFVVS